MYSLEIQRATETGGRVNHKIQKFMVGGCCDVPHLKPNQIGLITCHWRNRWEYDFSSKPHRGRIGSPKPVHWTRSCFVGQTLEPKRPKKTFSLSCNFNFHNCCQREFSWMLVVFGDKHEVMADFIAKQPLGFNFQIILSC